MRLSFALVAALLALSVVAPLGGAATLTAKNSVSASFPFDETVDASAPDCATPAVAVLPLPKTATSAKINSPKVPSSSSLARLVSADTVGPDFSLTFIGEPESCDPELNDSPPGTPIPWGVSVRVIGTYAQRVAVCLRPYFDPYSYKKCKNRPKRVYTGIEGIEKGFRQYYYGIRWKSFGGKSAVGRGKLKQECTSPGRCERPRKVRIVADKSKYCGSSKSVEYTRLTSYSGGKLWFRQRKVC